MKKTLVFGIALISALALMVYAQAPKAPAHKVVLDGVEYNYGIDRDPDGTKTVQASVTRGGGLTRKLTYALTPEDESRVNADASNIDAIILRLYAQATQSLDLDARLGELRFRKLDVSGVPAAAAELAKIAKSKPWCSDFGCPVVAAGNIPATLAPGTYTIAVTGR